MLGTVLTKDERSSAQGEDATAGDALLRIAGGIKLQRSIARVWASRKESGSSVLRAMVGRLGITSTRACIMMYRMGYTPETMKDGGIPSRGPDYSEGGG
jgi:hypothetical protein